MSITLYAGVTTKNAFGQETLKFSYPVVIAHANTMEGTATDGNYPIETKALIKHEDNQNVFNTDVIPTDLVSVVKKVFSITGTDFSSADGKTISLFSNQNDVQSKLNFEIKILSAGNNNFHLFIGDFKRGCYLRAQYFPAVGNNDIYIVINNSYDGDNFVEMLRQVGKFEQLNFVSGSYNYWFNYPVYAPFYLYHSYSVSVGGDKVDLLSCNEAGMLNANSYCVNLSRYASWYVMLTGKYPYGNPIYFDLPIPVGDIDRVEMAVPVAWGANDEGLVVSNGSGKGSYTGISYYCVGTDLTQLFSATSTSGSVLLGSCQLKKYDGNSYSLTAGSKGLFANSFDNNPQKLNYLNAPYILKYYAGLYLYVHADYVNDSPKLWLSKIPETYSEYEYGNCPIFFGSYSTGYYNNKVNYFDYATYPNAKVPGVVSNFINSDNYRIAYNNTPTEIDYSFWKSFLDGLSNLPGMNVGDGSIGGGGSNPGGGDGDFDDTGDSIPFAVVPSGFEGLGAMFTMYHPINSVLQQLGTWLNKQETGSLAYVDKISGIISLKQIYTPGGSISTSGGGDIIVSGVDTGVGCTILTRQYEKFSMGSYNFSEYFGSFLDYSPHTSLKIYLPFVGIKDLDVDEFMAGSLKLSVIINYATGDLQYQIMAEKNTVSSVIYEFNGNCSCEVPMTASDYSGKVSSTTNLLLGIAGSVIGVAAAPITGGTSLSLSAIGAGSLVHSAINASHSKGKYYHSGSASSCLGFMSTLTPFLIITRPKMSLPENYAHDVGYPSSISTTLGSLTGFTVVDNVHLEGFSQATQEELDEIESKLKSGVLF